MARGVHPRRVVQHRFAKLALAQRMSQGRPVRAIAIAALALLAACDGAEPAPVEDHDADPTEAAVEAEQEVVRERVDSRPPPMARPVPLWENGASAREVDAATADLHGYFLLDLGEAWTPYLFTEASTESEARVPHAYRETYLALARAPC